MASSNTADESSNTNTSTNEDNTDTSMTDVNTTGNPADTGSDANTQTTQNPPITANATVDNDHAAVHLAVYNTRPPRHPFINNNLIAAMEHPGTVATSLPVPVQQTRQFHNWSINSNGNYARQYSDRIFSCTICNDNPREVTVARRHHARYHPGQNFETVTQESRRERWKGEAVPKEPSDEESEDDKPAAKKQKKN